MSAPRTSTVIHIREDAYRKVQKLKDKARRQGHKISAGDVLDMAVRRMLHDAMTPRNEEEKRLVRLLLAAIRRPGPRPMRRTAMRTIEILLSGIARGELDTASTTPQRAVVAKAAAPRR